jgi:hypothetical protein
LPTDTLPVSNGPAPATRVVALTELVSTYLRAIAPSAYCDPCLAGAVQEPLEPLEPLEPVRRTAEALTCPEQFARKVGRCTLCRSTKWIVTRVDPRRF